MKEPTRIYFVVPCYREEEILPDSCPSDDKTVSLPGNRVQVPPGKGL